MLKIENLPIEDREHGEWYLDASYGGDFDEDYVEIRCARPVKTYDMIARVGCSPYEFENTPDCKWAGYVRLFFCSRELLEMLEKVLDRLDCGILCESAEWDFDSDVKKIVSPECDCGIQQLRVKASALIARVKGDQ